MLNVVFKNLDRSELAIEAVVERLQPTLDKFPDLTGSHLNVTLEMQNAPQHASPDLFTVTLYVKNGRYKGIRLTKSASNLYVALASIVEHLLEKLNRMGDRIRVKSRNQARGIQAAIPSVKIPENDFDQDYLDQSYPLQSDGRP